MRNGVRFPSSLRRLGSTAAALWLGGLVFAAPAVAADMVPEAVFFYKLGTGTSEGPLVVTMNNDGVWANSQVNERTWSLAYRVEWSTAVGMVKNFRVYAKASVGPGTTGLGSQAEIDYAEQQNVAWTLIEQGKIAQFEATAAVAAVFPSSGAASTPGGVCQLKRNELLAAGASLHEVLSNDWIVEREVIATAVLDYYKDFEPSSTPGGFSSVNGKDPAQVGAVVYLPLTVLCKGDKAIAEAVAPLYQGSYAANFQVTDAKLHIAPAYQNLTAKCPVTVPLVAEFTAANAGSLKFRFVSASGKVSQLYTAQISGKTGGIYKGLYEKLIQVPLAQGGGTGAGQSGGGIVNQQAGGGLAIQISPEEPLFPSAPSSGGMGQVQTNPLAGNVHSESFRVEVVEPSTGIVSAYAGYRITCKPKTAGIAGPQNLQVQPKASQPAVGLQPRLRALPRAVPTPPQRVAPTLHLAPQPR